MDALLAGLESPEPGDDEVDTAMLDATSSLLATYGLHRWTMDDVASRAGLGRATVYRRFASRDDLVHATLLRDARRYFAAIAAAVNDVESVEDKVVEGFLVGCQLLRGAPATALLMADPRRVMALGRAALVERYQIVNGVPLSGPARADAELVAEALVRLGLSFVLMPDSTIDLDDTEGARRALRRLLGPLLAY
ncbi:MAG TPA: helix-turn-helix domain-containing protein [Acidimicrobiales bacterium]|jgi:AcrR family transcriptional regulator